MDDNLDLHPDIQAIRRDIAELQTLRSQIKALQAEVAALKGAKTTGQSASASSVSVSTGVTRHGDLTGLDADDHTQYLTQARGDARYVQESAGQSVVVVTAKLTGGGVQGSMTFVNGQLTASSPAT